MTAPSKRSKLHEKRGSSYRDHALEVYVELFGGRDGRVDHARLKEEVDCVFGEEDVCRFVTKTVGR